MAALQAASHWFKSSTAHTTQLDRGFQALNLSPELTVLGRYLAGEFDNQTQAIAEPTWYVHLRLWHRPISLFAEDSITLFAEQASSVTLDRPYRQRIIRLQQGECYRTGYRQRASGELQAEYYMLKNPETVRGGGLRSELLQSLTPDDMEFLPGCTLAIAYQQLAVNTYTFSTSPATDNPCRFTYRGTTYQVALGFDVTSEELRTYDRGIDPTTGKVLWGPMMGPFCFTKLQDFSSEA